MHRSWLTKEDVRYLQIDNAEEQNDFGKYSSPINELKVKFEVKFYSEVNYFVWDIVEVIGQESKVLFRLWLDNVPVEFNQKGIKTTLYKAVKFKPSYDTDLDSVIEF